MQAIPDIFGGNRKEKRNIRKKREGQRRETMRKKANIVSFERKRKNVERSTERGGREQ